MSPEIEGHIRDRDLPVPHTSGIGSAHTVVASSPALSFGTVVPEATARAMLPMADAIALNEAFSPRWSVPPVDLGTLGRLAWGAKNLFSGAAALIVAPTGLDGGRVETMLSPDLRVTGIGMDTARIIKRRVDGRWESTGVDAYEASGDLVFDRAALERKAGPLPEALAGRLAPARDPVLDHLPGFGEGVDLKFPTRTGGKAAEPLADLPLYTGGRIDPTAGLPQGTRMAPTAVPDMPTVTLPPNPDVMGDGVVEVVPLRLQTGGNRLSGQTADALNETFGTDYGRRDWESFGKLKGMEGLRGDHHGAIHSDGSYRSAEDPEEVIGYLDDFVAGSGRDGRR